MNALNDIGNVTTGDMDEGCDDAGMEAVAYLCEIVSWSFVGKSISFNIS
jgi:hypothetical protein